MDQTLLGYRKQYLALLGREVALQLDRDVGPTSRTTAA